MRYRLKGPLNFEEVPQLNEKLREALVAANKGRPYRAVVEQYDPERGVNVRIYLSVIYEGETPAGIQVGEDVATGISTETTEHLSALGIQTYAEQPWSTAPLVKRRRSWPEFWQEVQAGNFR